MQLSPRQWMAFGAGAAGAAVLTYLYGDPVTAIQIAAGFAMNVFEKGAELSRSTLTGGIVDQSVGELISQASDVLGFPADPETYALARMGRSEGVDGMEYRMHVALNDLANLQTTYGFGVYSSIEQLMVHSKLAAADGRFSQQQFGKRYATTQDPFAGDYQLADQVRRDHDAGIDPTGGARKFVDKSSFKTQPGATNTYDEQVAAWALEGLTPRTLPNATTNFVVFS